MPRNAEGSTYSGTEQCCSSRARQTKTELGEQYDRQKYRAVGKKKKIKKKKHVLIYRKPFSKKLYPGDQCLSQVPQWTTDSLVLRTLTALLGGSCRDTSRQTSTHKTVYANRGCCSQEQVTQTLHYSFPSPIALLPCLHRR